jgi:hypothetical protein
LLEQHIDKINQIDWYLLSKNPNIIEYDYQTMKTNTSVYKEELIAKAFHPSRVIKWIYQDYDPSEM